MLSIYESMRKADLLRLVKWSYWVFQCSGESVRDIDVAQGSHRLGCHGVSLRILELILRCSHSYSISNMYLTSLAWRVVCRVR
jgi:hypothetical protein